MADTPFEGRREDEPLLRGQSTYIDGLNVPELTGAAQAVFVRSAEAHACLASVDVTEARQADGVIAVYLGPDVDGWPFPPRLPSMNRDLWRPLMAYDTVRFVGEPIGMVIAETRAAATDAAELVIVDYEPLPPVVDLDASSAGPTWPVTASSASTTTSGPKAVPGRSHSARA